MTFKTISDKPQTFTFTYDFSDIDTAQVASHAVLGYMTGTYHAPAIDSTIKGGGQLVLEYAEDSNLNDIFKHICDSFKDYYTAPEEVDTVKEQYRLDFVVHCYTVRRYSEDCHSVDKSRCVALCLWE